MAIKFQKFYVTDGVTKARVSYSEGQIFAKGDRTKLLDCVTLYAKDYSDKLGEIFKGRYENDTDLMTDYFDEGRVRIFPGDPLYEEAIKRARANVADRQARYAAKRFGVERRVA
jgi:hypothetical protein